MTITKKAKTAIKEDVRVRAALMAAFDRGEKSILNWIVDDNIKLTTPLAVKTISELTGLTPEQIIA